MCSVSFFLGGEIFPNVKGKGREGKKGGKSCSGCRDGWRSSGRGLEKGKRDKFFGKGWAGRGLRGLGE